MSKIPNSSSLGKITSRFLPLLRIQGLALGWVLMLVLVAGCERASLEVEEVPEPETMHVGLVLHPWDDYFAGVPSLLLVKSIPSSVERLLEQQQRLAKAVLDGHGATPIMEIAPLQARLAELKTMIPDAETRSGYVYRGSTRTGIVYTSDGYTYARTGGTYYDYPVFRMQYKSSSPELVRSVHGIVHNAGIDDLEQRITALQQLTSVWSRRNSMMSTNGSSGLMRAANEAYLQELRALVREFLDLQRERDAALARHATSQQDHERNLESWQAFEQNELPVLRRFFERNTIHTIICEHPDHSYEIPRRTRDEQYVLSYSIGPRTLYFPIQMQPSKWHPFVKVDLGSSLAQNR